VLLSVVNALTGEINATKQGATGKTFTGQPDVDVLDYNFLVGYAEYVHLY
jgi:hypothetical protein